MRVSSAFVLAALWGPVSCGGSATDGNPSGDGDSDAPTGTGGDQSPPGDGDGDSGDGDAAGGAGGDEGDAGGTQSGGSEPELGGAPAAGGEESTGGAPPAGGAPTTGGDPGSGGAQGGGDSGVVEELGSPCDSPAALACAGNNQLVTLLCDGDSWTVNQTCPTDQACDSTPGATQGTCQPRIVECSVSDTFCEDDSTLAECGPDRVNVTTSQCEHSCMNGECDERPNYCPAGDYTNCGEECAGGNASTCTVNDENQCLQWGAVALEPGETTTVRIPVYEDVCTVDWCETSEHAWGIFQAVVVMDTPAPVKIRTDANLVLVDGADCPEAGAVSQCIVLVPEDDRVTVGAMTDDPSMLEQNLFIEVESPGETLSCP